VGSIELTPGTREKIVAEVADGQYRFESPGHPMDDPWPESEDGLTTGEDGWFVVLAGIEWGPLDVSVEYRAGAPADVAPGWETVSQRSFYIPNAVFEILTTSLDVVHTVSIPSVGWHVVRVHVRGRDSRLAKNHQPGGMEEHLLQIWPADSKQPASLLVGPDHYGQAFLN
jgi:hypothetical protein